MSDNISATPVRPHIQEVSDDELFGSLEATVQSASESTQQNNSAPVGDAELFDSIDSTAKAEKKEADRQNGVNVSQVEEEITQAEQVAAAAQEDQTTSFGQAREIQQQRFLEALKSASGERSEQIANIFEGIDPKDYNQVYGLAISHAYPNPDQDLAANLAKTRGQIEAMKDAFQKASLIGQHLGFVLGSLDNKELAALGSKLDQFKAKSADEAKSFKEEQEAKADDSGFLSMLESIPLIGSMLRSFFEGIFSIFSGEDTPPGGGEPNLTKEQARKVS